MSDQQVKYDAVPLTKLSSSIENSESEKNEFAVNMTLYNVFLITN